MTKEQRESILSIIKQHIPTWGPMQAPLPVDEIAEKIVYDIEHLWEVEYHK